MVQNSVNTYNHCGKQSVFSINRRLPYDLVLQVLAYVPNRNAYIYVLYMTCAGMCLVGLFVIAKDWQQTKYPQQLELINKSQWRPCTVAHAYNPSTLRGRGGWITRSSDRDHPGQQGETASRLKKNTKISWAWYHSL